MIGDPQLAWLRTLFLRKSSSSRSKASSAFKASFFCDSTLKSADSLAVDFFLRSRHFSAATRFFSRLYSRKAESSSGGMPELRLSAVQLSSLGLPRLGL